MTRSCLVNPQRRPAAASGFTIIELLVVIGIIGALVGLIFPAFRAVRSTSRQSNELASARQIMTAYITYAAQNNDRVMPGYYTQIGAFDELGRTIDKGPKTGRYPWRLAPFLNYDFRGMYVNEHAAFLERMEQAGAESFSSLDELYQEYIYRVSLSPSFGLNTTWIGGDEQELGFLPPTSPLRTSLDLDRFCLTQLSNAQFGDRLMVFASARGVDPLEASPRITEGFFKVTSPRLTALQPYRWAPTWEEADPNVPAQFGFLSARHKRQVVCAFIDGHTGPLSPEQLQDMRHWANWADSADWSIPQLD